MKNALCEQTSSYFNLQWDTEIICDASPVGVSGILTQISPTDGSITVIAYASRTLTDAVTLDEVITLTINDEVMKLLYESIKRGTLDCVKYPQLTCFSRVFNELPIVNGIIIKGENILIPSNLRQRVLSAGHDGHQGLEKTRYLALKDMVSRN